MACNNDIFDVLAAFLPEDVYIITGVPNARVNDGSKAVEEGDQSFTIPDFEGWKTRLIRNGVPQFLGNPGDGNSYFDYTSITAEFTLSQDVVEEDTFIVQAYKPS